jgi:hypothetical protein
MDSGLSQDARLALYKRRPFRVRNADEYGLESVLNLFVSPIDGLATPFEYENSIIKGRMGSGKTMYLRANFAYYLYAMVPSLLEQDSELILPVFIRLSDFQHLKSPDQIYRAIIIKIVEEMTSVYLRLEDAKKLAALHAGVRVVPQDLLRSHRLAESMVALAQLGSEEYVQRVTTELGISGGVKHSFLQGSADWRKTSLDEFRKKPDPGIRDIENCYKSLLEDQDGRLLLLIDEAGSLERSFFHSDTGTPIFEVLMNQFRTTRFIRTKVAVYPRSYSDMLTETRYGDVVSLEESVLDKRGYDRFHSRAVSLVRNYLSPDGGILEFQAHDVFDTGIDGVSGALEQLIYASNGNMRRLIQLLDASINVAYVETEGATVVSKQNALDALTKQAEDLESLFTQQDKDFLADLVSVCKTRGGFRFTFPNMSPILYRFVYKSEEYNVLRIDSLGAGRRKTVYAFDYAFSVLREIPTHHVLGTEKVHRDRSLAGGEWIGRTIQVSKDVVDHAAFPGKQEGEVCHWVPDRGGFVRDLTGADYFFQAHDVIESDRGKQVRVGLPARFYPFSDGGHDYATHVELLV